MREPVQCQFEMSSGRTVSKLHKYVFYGHNFEIESHWLIICPENLLENIRPICFLPFCYVKYLKHWVRCAEKRRWSRLTVASQPSGGPEPCQGLQLKQVSREFSLLNVSLILEFRWIKLPVMKIFGPSTRQGAPHCLVPACSSCEYYGPTQPLWS